MIYTDENETACVHDSADCPQTDDPEIEVIVAGDFDNTGGAGCFLLPILLLLIVFIGSILAFQPPAGSLNIILKP